MDTKTFKAKIHLLQGQVLKDITETARLAGLFHFIYDYDAPPVNTCLRFYDGNKYPVKVVVESMSINEDGVLEFCAGNGRRYTVDKMHSGDIATLNKGVETVQKCKTPARFAALVNKMENFPIALHEIMDSNGWYDLTDEENTGNICWCPKEKTMVLFENGKAITRKMGDYGSLEMDWHHAEEWFHQSDFVTMERISGYKQFDFSDVDGQDFADAVENWWAKLGKTEKIQVWKENK